MDLLFTISGLLLVASAASFLKREAAALLRLTGRKPRNLFAIQVPVEQEQVLADLQHFARRNHLDFTLTQTACEPAMIIRSRSCRNILFAVYFTGNTEPGCRIEIAAAHLDQAPYLFFRKKHAEAARAIGSHLRTSWERRRHFNSFTSTHTQTISQ